MSREVEATNRLCLVLGALTAIAPDDNEPIRELISECYEFLLNAKINISNE